MRSKDGDFNGEMEFGLLVKGWQDCGQSKTSGRNSRLQRHVSQVRRYVLRIQNTSVGF